MSGIVLQLFCFPLVSLSKFLMLLWTISILGPPDILLWWILILGTVWHSSFLPMFADVSWWCQTLLLCFYLDPMVFQLVSLLLANSMVLLDSYQWGHPWIIVMSRLCTKFLVDATPSNRLHPLLKRWWILLMLLLPLDHPTSSCGLCQIQWDNFLSLKLWLVWHTGFVGLDLLILLPVVLIHWIADSHWPLGGTSPKYYPVHLPYWWGSLQRRPILACIMNRLVIP